MAERYTVGVDIGTYHIKVVVLQYAMQNDKVAPRVIGTGLAESRGVRHGYIVSRSEIGKSVAAAIRSAEKSSGMRIKEAYASLGGIGLGSVTTSGSTAIARGDLEIGDQDVEEAIEAARQEISAQYGLNRRIIHHVPIIFKVDGRSIPSGKPTGMKGTRLETKVLFITGSEQHYNDLIGVIEDAGVEVFDVVASPIAGSIITLSKAQKIAGVVLVNIGAETVSLVVYENNAPTSLEVFPLGGSDITNDIALGLKIPLEEAEEVKRGDLLRGNYSRRKLEEIVNARLSDIFELIEAHLKKIGRSRLLPAGIVITGGTSRIASIDETAKHALELPSRVSGVTFGGAGQAVGDSVWAVAYGLAFIGLSDDRAALGVDFITKTKRQAFRWLRQFLP